MSLISSQDKFGDALADHHGGDVGVGADAVGHDGGVHHAQVLHALDPALLIDHRHGVGVGSHLAGAGDVLGGGHVGAEPVVQGRVGLQVGVQRFRAFLDYVGEVAMVAQFRGDAHAVPQPLAVELFLQVVVVQVGLLVRVGGLELQLARAHGQVDGNRGADAQRLHAVAAADDLLGGKGREDHYHVVAQVGAFGGVLEARLDPGRETVELEARLGAPGDGHDGMVAEVLADAGAVVNHGDAEAAQVLGGADAGEHEQLGRGDGAAAEDDLIAFHGEDLAAGFDHHAGRLIAVKQDAVDGAVGADGQVEAVTGHVEVAQGGAPTDAVGVIEGRGADAGGIRAVVVVGMGEAVGAGGVVESGLSREPLLALETAGDDGAVVAVEVVGEVGVRLQAAEAAQQVLEAPLVVAHGGPGVVVLGDAAQEHLAVDGAGAAGDFAAGNHDLGVLSGAVSGELPVVIAGHDVGGGGVAELHLIGQVLEVGVVGSGFQQQHRSVGVFAQPGGHDGTGRAGADDDVVVLQGYPPCVRSVRFQENAGKNCLVSAMILEKARQFQIAAGRKPGATRSV